MSSPVELRFFVERATLEEVAANPAGVTSLQIGPAVNGIAPRVMFKQPPVLQYRFKEKVYLAGAPSVEWSDWQTVMFVREGEEPPASG